MPTYEYRCPEGHQFELFQRMSDEPRADCPTCGAAAERLLSAGAGFLFKGDGFYITDYRSEGYQKAAKAERGRASDKGNAGDKAGKPKGTTEGGSSSAKDSGVASPKPSGDGGSSSSKKGD